MQFSLKIHVAFALVSHGTSQDPSGNQTKPIPSRHGKGVTPDAELMRGIVRTPSRLPETPPATRVPFSRAPALALWAVVPRDENLGNGKIRGAHDLGDHSALRSRFRLVVWLALGKDHVVGKSWAAAPVLPDPPASREEAADSVW